jgi:hypothetical protein
MENLFSSAFAGKMVSQAVLMNLLPLRSLFKFVFAGAALLPLTLSAAPAAGLLDNTHANVRAIAAVQQRVTGDLMKVPGVLGTAIGLDDDGNVSLIVYVDQNHPNAKSIKSNGTYTIVLTDSFRAGGKPGPVPPPVSHTAKQTPPIKLGSSGGWGQDLANGFCCGGTLGSLIQVNGVQYIMSNYHVMESDIVSGGNGIVATSGSFVIQPGLIDVNCDITGAQAVGGLVKLESLPANNIDVGVAQAISGMVASDGAILEIGTISATTANAALRQAVKKSGRTTGLTKSSITGLNATISVAYDNECAGGPAFTRVFSGQIVIGNKGNKFLNSGDSGSLLVQDVASKPKAIGLLYAGSSTTAIANPIGDVLTFVGGKLGGAATMVGN